MFAIKLQGILSEQSIIPWAIHDPNSVIAHIPQVLTPQAAVFLG